MSNPFHASAAPQARDKMPREIPQMSHPMLPERQGLYDPQNEHDACGVGFVAHIKGKKTHSIVEHGLQILRNLTHRGAVGADPLAGDGAGILIQMPDQFFREELAKQGVKLPPMGEYGVGIVFLPQEPASLPSWPCPPPWSCLPCLSAGRSPPCSLRPKTSWSARRRRGALRPARSSAPAWVWQQSH